MYKIQVSLLTTIAIAVTNITFGQEIMNHSNLKLEEIMKGNEFIGYQPENQFWSIDGKTIYFDWNPKNDPTSSLYAYHLKGEAKKVDDTQNAFPKIDIKFEKSAFEYQGNLYVYDTKHESTQLIFDHSKRISNVTQFDAKEAYFFLDNTIIKYSFLDRSISELVRIDKGQKLKDNKNGLL